MVLIYILCEYGHSGSPSKFGNVLLYTIYWVEIETLARRARLQKWRPVHGTQPERAWPKQACYLVALKRAILGSSSSRRSLFRRILLAGSPLSVVIPRAWLFGRFSLVVEWLHHVASVGRRYKLDYR